MDRAKAGQDELSKLQLLRPNNEVFINFEKYQGLEKESQNIPQNVNEYISDLSA